MKKVWIQVNGKLIPKEQYVRERAEGPMIMGDIEPYRNVVDGKMITSRSQHREFLKRNGLQEVGNEKTPFVKYGGKTEYNAKQQLDRYTHKEVLSKLMRS